MSVDPCFDAFFGGVAWSAAFCNASLIKREDIGQGLKGGERGWRNRYDLGLDK